MSLSGPSRKMSVARAYLPAIGALLVGVIIGLSLPAMFPAFAGLGSSEPCTEVQNEYREIRGRLDMWEGDGVDGDAASALFELLERRPDCIGDDDRALIEDFRMFLDQGR